MSHARTEIPIVVLNPDSPFNPINNAPVVIYDRNEDGTRGSASTVYNSADGDDVTELTNPGLTTDTSGRITGWLERGAYEAVISVAGHPDYSEFLDSAPATDEAIDTAWLQDSAVTTPKLATGAVTTPKISAGAVTNAEVNAGAAIAYSKLNLATSILNSDISASAAIVHSKLANTTAGYIIMGNASGILTGTALSGDATISSGGALTIANDAVTTPKILDLNVTTGKLNDLAVTTGKLAANAVTEAKVTAGTLTNASISVSAAIAYGKLNLTGSIVNADVSGSAAIGYGKLNLAGSIVNADISNSAAVAYSKLALTGSLVNADVNASAAIAYSKLNLAGAITNADLAGSIAHTKLATTTAGYVLMGNGSGVITGTALSGDVTISSGGVTTIATGAIAGPEIAANAVSVGKLARSASAGQVLIGGGAGSDSEYRTISGDATISSTGVLSLSAGVVSGGAIGTGSVTEPKLADNSVSTRTIEAQAVTLAKLARGTAGTVLIGQGGSDTAYTALSGDVTINSSGVTTIGSTKVTNAMLAGSIATSKLANITAGYFLMGNGSGAVTPTQLTGDISVSNTGVVTVASISGSGLAANSVDEGKLSRETSGSILIGQGASDSIYVVPTGDVTLSTGGVTTIAANAVDTNKLASHASTDASRAVNTNHIRDAAVTNAKVAANTLTPSKISRDTSGTVLIAKGAGADVAFTSLSGDVTVDSSGVTAIGNNKVTSAMLAGSIAYSKLTLTGAVTNADLAGSIAYGKLALTGQILNADLAGSIAYSKLSLTGAITNADLAGSIALSKLATDPLARANHTGTQTAATISDFNTAVRTNRLDQMTAPTASVAMGSQRMTGLADGIDPTDAATVGQVGAGGEGGEPTGSAGGALGGTYPNPGLALSVAGDGITNTSSVLAVGAGTGISVSSDAVAIDTSVVPRLGSANAYTAAQTITLANSEAFNVRSGASGSYVSASFGRTSTEGILGVAAGAGHYFPSTVAGDFVVRADGTALHLGVGAAAAAEIRIENDKLGFFGTTPASRSGSWSMSNFTSNKTLNYNTFTLNELGRAFATLVDALKAHGLIA